MKAVIMAGGFGTRLRPITETIPKPCVPVLGVPCIRRIVDQLSAVGVTDFLVSLMYLPDAVRRVLQAPDLKGTRISFFEETVPLGTAGSVRNCLPQTDEDFIVISGDCVFDFDLSPAWEFHRSHGGLVTILSTRSDDPLEYGVLISDASGRVTRFVEKPDWSRAFSDDVNTGIYLCSPGFLNWIPEGTCDFSRDVFPEMLRRGAPIYRCAVDGYWCDVGNVASYLDCTRYLLSVRGDVLSSPVENAATESPCMIGSDTDLSGCHIGPFTVIGECCSLHGARLEGCVVGNHVTAEPGVSARNCVICDGTVLRAGARLGDECVIGAGCEIGRHAIVSARSRIYPENHIPDHAFVSENVHRKLRSLYPQEGKLLFPFGEDFGGSGFYELGRTLADLFEGDVLVGRAEQGDAAASMTLCGGILARGRNVFDAGVCDPAQFRFSVHNYAFRCGVFLQRNYSNLVLHFYNENGMPFSSSAARRLDRKLQEDSPCGESDGIYRVFRGGRRAYQTFLRSFTPPQRLMLRVVPTPELSPFLPAPADQAVERMRISSEGIRIEHLDTGEPYDENYIRLCFLLSLGARSSVVFIPDDYPAVAERLAAEHGFKLNRLTSEDARERKLFPLTDPNVQALLVLKYLSDHRCTFGAFCDGLPGFSVKYREVPVSAKRAAVMRTLVGSGGEIRDGVVFSERSGVVRIVPKATANAFRISSEAADAETAEELCNFYAMKLKGLKPD